MITTFVLECLLLQNGAPHVGGTLKLEEVDLAAMSAGWGVPQKNLSVTRVPLSIGGVRFDRGIGTHAESSLVLRLDGKATNFTARVGVDDNANSTHASLEFVVWGDDRELWRSGLCRWKEAARDCRVALGGVTELELCVESGGDGIDFDHGDWCEPTVDFDGAPPQVEKPALEPDLHPLLTPPPPPMPQIHGPLV